MKKQKLIDMLELYLENMCEYIAIGHKDLFRYYAGKANAIREILEIEYWWDESEASEHIKNMWDLMDENW